MKRFFSLKSIVLSLIAFLLIISGATLTSCKKEPKEIKIGAILPLTGPAAKYGESIKRGIDLAAEEVKSAGGINNRRIAIIYEDSQADPKIGASVAQKLITMDKVPAILGAVASSVTLSISPIAEKNKVVVLTPLSSAPTITDAGDYIFRNVPSDFYGGKVAAQFAVLDRGWKTLAILYQNNDFGVGLKKVFENEVKKFGGEIIDAESFEQGGTDFRTQLIKIHKSKPQAIFIVAGKEAIQILIQAKELSLNSQFLATGMIEDPEVIKIAGNAANGVYFTQLQYDSHSKNTVVQDFVKYFKKEYGSEPDIISAYGYDAMKILAYAMGNSNFTSMSIKNALYKIKNFKGVTGDISFDTNGDVIQSMGIKVIEGGKFKWFKNPFPLK
jgi:branched-chain amino acid transport system substrate-binding protein